MPACFKVERWRETVDQLEPTVSTSRGEDVGYGISMPFTKVTVRLAYRLLTRDGRDELAILAAGNEEATGLAPAPADAQALALKNLAERAVPLIMAKIDQRMKELSNKVTVTVAGVTTPDETFAIRDTLQRITWVAAVEDLTLGSFRVSYPENPLYLANGLTQRGFRIVSYSKDAIQVRRP